MTLADRIRIRAGNAQKAARVAREQGDRIRASLHHDEAVELHQIATEVEKLEALQVPRQIPIAFHSEGVN